MESKGEIVIYKSPEGETELEVNRISSKSIGSFPFNLALRTREL